MIEIDPTKRLMTKVIEFGTKVRGKVIGNGPNYIVVGGEDGEGYVLFGGVGLVGADGVMEFKPGGPTGGHWHFIPDIPDYCECCEGQCERPYECPHCHATRPCGDGSHCQACYRNNDPDFDEDRDI